MRLLNRMVPGAALLLAACGHSLSGEYSSERGAFFDKLVFRSGKEVEITFMGSTGVGSYKIDGKRVLITVNGSTQVFEADGACIDGGATAGRYCKR